MTHDTVSAIPEKLVAYAKRAIAIDSDVRLRAGRLRSRLEHFEARCREPGLTVRGSGLADRVRGLASDCEVVDRLVGDVGRRFRMADSRWSTSSHFRGSQVAVARDANSVPIQQFLFRVTRFAALTTVPGWLAMIVSSLPWCRQEPEQAIPEPTPKPAPKRRTPDRPERETVSRGTPAPEEQDRSRVRRERARVRSISDAEKYHICQVEAELSVGGDGRTANCGPASLAVALHALDLKVKGEKDDMKSGEVVDLARKSMVTDEARDGVDSKGNRVEAEHSRFTYWSDLERGAQAAGVSQQRIKPDAGSIEKAIGMGGTVIVSGGFTGKNPLPWTGDRGHDNDAAPGGATDHVVAVTGYDSQRNLFIVSDPARAKPLAVAPETLEYFMQGNPGALKISRP